MKTVFRPVNPVLDRNMFIFKVTVFVDRAKYEWNTVFYCPLRGNPVKNILISNPPLKLETPVETPAIPGRKR